MGRLNTRGVVGGFFGSLGESQDKVANPLPVSPCFSRPHNATVKQSHKDRQRDRGTPSNEETCQMPGWPCPKGTQVMLTPQIPTLGPTIRKHSDITTDRAPSIVESQTGPLQLHGSLGTQGRLPMEPQNQTQQES